ncbi:MAG: hypothetical protein KatS3mg111_4303 [Pirellulaceae bacterium]|nr:MAG: hypothetical protein KatS3mg111_4303 [Pirellulaceae bacterium]
MSDAGAAKDASVPIAPASQPESTPVAVSESRLSQFVARYGHVIRDVASVIVFGFALWLLHHEFKSVHLADIEASFRALPWWSIGLALLFTACNYVVLIGYDWLGVRLVHHPLSFRQVTIASLLYYAFSNSLGAVFGGTPVRVRLYSGWGMSSQEIVRMIVFIAAAFWVGLFTLSGTLFLVTPF